MTDDDHYLSDVKINKYFDNNALKNILVCDDDMAPEIPEGAFVQIREVKPDEDLIIGAFYYIEFNNKKCFRTVIDDHIDGVSFLPNHMNERRIAYDRDYVNIIGKAVSMKVFFEDEL